LISQRSVCGYLDILAPEGKNPVHTTFDWREMIYLFNRISGRAFDYRIEENVGSLLSKKVRLGN